MEAHHLTSEGWEDPVADQPETAERTVADPAVGQPELDSEKWIRRAAGS